jgi:hypothetical protein
MQKLPREYYTLGWKLLPKLVENSTKMEWILTGKDALQLFEVS